MSKKKTSFKTRIKNLNNKKNALIDHIIKIYEGYSFENDVVNRLINAAKVFVVATRKFLVDDCFTKASAVAYTAIISLIPALTVVLTFYTIFSGAENKKDDLFREVSIFMIDHGIKINIAPFIEAISKLIDNAARIGGIGAVVMLFTATGTLRAIEKALNDIWKVKAGRSILQRVVYYWAILTLGPVMLIAGTTVATKLSTAFSSANLNSAAIHNNTIWLTGSKGTIMQGQADGNKFFQIEETSIDIENQRAFIYKDTEKVFIEDEFRMGIEELMNRDFSDIQFLDSKGWIVGTKGTILQTENGGKTWQLNKWGNFNFNAIYMISPAKGFIASDSGIILKTENSGKDWQIVNTGDDSVTYLSIAFNQNTGIITGTNGKILYSGNYGETWTTRTINEAKQKKKISSLNTVFFADKNEVWIAGNEGLILKSTDKGLTWSQNKFKEYNFYSMVFLNKHEGYIAGESGTIIRTINGGETWRSEKLPTNRINKMLLSEKETWAVGNGGTIQHTSNNAYKWSGKSGKSFTNMAVNFFAPFLFIWILFVVAYTTIPNTKIPFRFSAIGAAFTGTVWVIFILLFIYYVKAFAKGTFAIYGALAAFPLFLLMVYASALIILYGAEVSYTLMHPETYKSLKNTFKDIRKVNLYYGLAILNHIYAKFESGKGSSTYSEIMKKIKFNAADQDYFIKLFTDQGYIDTDNKGRFIPTGPAESIKLLNIFDTIHESEMLLPPGFKKNSNRTNIKEIFNQLTDARHKVLGEMTLKDLKM